MSEVLAIRNELRQMRLSVNGYIADAGKYKLECKSLRARLALAEDAMMAADCMGNWMLVSPKKWQRKLSIDYRAKAEAFRRAEK